MKTMDIMINGNLETVQVERYFRALNNQYLIYSKDEADVDGNVRINVIKIENNQVVPIEETSEWDTVKKIIVEIVNDNRELSKLSVEDLDYQGLENLNVVDAKALRLPSAVMPYLSANQPDFNSLEVKEQQLDDKVEALKDMNRDLATMMDEVGKEFAVAKPQNEDNEEKMGATMEIIMPSKQVVKDAKEDKENVQKEKGHFNFKNLFGKKKNKEDEKPKEEVEPKVEETESVKEEVKEELPVSIEETTVTVAPEMETPDVNVETEEKPVLEISETVSEIVPEENNTVTLETPKEEVTGFDFFDQMPEISKPEPIVVTPDLNMATEIPDIPENNTPTEPEEEPTEILELEEDQYKNLYDEEQKKNALLEAQVQALTGNMKRLEETLTDYQQRLNQIKSIVD